MSVNRVLKSLVVTAVIGGTLLVGGTAAHAAEPVAAPLTATASSDGEQQGNDPWDTPPPKTDPKNDPWDAPPSGNDPWDSAPKGNDPWDGAPHGNDPWD